MNKTRRKYNRYRTLKTICYLLGFPLLLLLVYFGSTSMIYSEAFTDTKYYGLIVVAALWVVVSILQVLFSMFSKSKSSRAMFSMVITLVLVIGGAVAFDIYAEKEFTKIAETNAPYGVTMKDYKHQINYYEAMTKDKGDMVDAYIKNVNRFTTVYNIGVKGDCFSDDYNMDGSIPTYNKERDAYFSPNGMYADGYVFSMDEAIDILITYHETQAKYTKMKKNVDEELSNAITAVKASSAYQTYQNSDEYKKAYNTTDGTAYNHMLTMEQVDEILAVLGGGVGDALESLKLVTGLLPASIKPYLNLLNENLSIDVLVNTINDLKLNTVISLLGYDQELMNVLYEALMPILKYATLPATTLQFDSVANFKTSINNISVKNLLTQLNFTKLNSVVSNFGLDLTNYQTLFTNGLTREFIEDIINELSLTSNLFFYQSPTVKPVFYFIEDEELKAYAYAKYYATVHGANVGSVLIGSNIGAVTFSSSGYPASHGFTLQELYQLRMDNSYMAKAYPVFAARRYMYVMGGVMLIMIALYYHNSRKQDEAFMQMTGGRR